MKNIESASPATDAAEMPRLEFLLAGLLRYGTWLAAAVTALGLAMTLIEGRTDIHGPIRIVTAGIGLFILLPVLRVVLMLFVFIAQRDYRFIAITTVVLTVIVAGCMLGMHMANRRTPAPKGKTINLETQR
jgi:uncharacterized membrane protein